MKEFLLYITKNNINGKVYAGKHIGNKTDPYIGSGTIFLRNAVKKYGKKNFTRRWLKLKILSEIDLNRLERRLIKIVKYFWKSNCYNIHEGGTGGDMCKYISDKKRKEINRRISNSKKLQYGKGLTTKQVEGRIKQRETLLFNLYNNPEIRGKVLLSQKKKGKKLSQRVKEKGLTIREIQRNMFHSLNGNYKLKYQIIFPCGKVEAYTNSSKNFKLQNLVEDHIFSKMNKEGQCTILKRTSRTKHRFPVGTVFKVLEKLY